MTPDTKPKLPPAEIRAILSSKGVAAPCLLGIRGYFRDSMGKPGMNDRAIYDDAMFVVSRTWVRSFNGNTDPSVARKGIAVLQPGVWSYETGFHGISHGHPYPAIRQRGAVTVRRDEVGEDTGFFAINIHRGSINGTSSLGCQTIPPDQYNAFLHDAYDAVGAAQGEAGARQRKPVTYVLVTRDEAEKILGRSL